MRRWLVSALLALAVGPVLAADNGIIITPCGTGCVTTRSKDVGLGVQSGIGILGDTAGNPIYGTAGTANANVLTVQGIASMTKLLVDGSGVTQPVSGTVTATQGTSPWADNVTQFGGVNLSTGLGASGTGIPRVTVSNDSTLADQVTTGSITTTQTVTANTSGQSSVGVGVTGSFTGTLVFEATIDGTNWVPTTIVQVANGTIVSSTTGPISGQANVGGMAGFRVRGNTVSVGTATVTLRAGVGVSTVMADNPLPVTQSTSPWVVSGTVTANAGTGSFTVAQATAANLNATVTGTVTANQGGAPWSDNVTQWNSVALGSPSAYGTSPGAVNVPGVNAFVTNTVAVSGTVTANQGGAPWSENITQFGGVALSTGTGASGTGIPRVTVSQDSKVQPWDGTNTATVKASGTNAATTDTALVMAPSPNPSTLCTSVKAVNQTASADLITSTNKLHICSIVLVSATAQNLSLVEGTGTTCATGTAALIGGTTASLAAAANGGFSAVSERAWLVTQTTADHLCLLQSGTGNVSGIITYTDHN